MSDVVYWSSFDLVSFVYIFRSSKFTALYVRVSYMQETVHTAFTSEHTHASSHRRETIRVRCMR